MAREGQKRPYSSCWTPTGNRWRQCGVGHPTARSLCDGSDGVLEIGRPHRTVDVPTSSQPTLPPGPEHPLRPEEDPPKEPSALVEHSALEVADILPRLRAGANRGHASHAQLKGMSAVETFGTAALGGYVARWGNAECGHTVIAHGSCLMGKIGNGEWRCPTPYLSAQST
jgi:hypothetical protein